MPLKTPPKLEDVGLKQWLDDRAAENNGLNYDNFIAMVGNDPDNPKVDKANLMRAFNRKSRHTIYRWLAQMKRELV